MTQAEGWLIEHAAALFDDDGFSIELPAMFSDGSRVEMHENGCAVIAIPAPVA